MKCRTIAVLGVVALFAALSMGSCELLGSLFGHAPTVSLTLVDGDGNPISHIYTDWTIYFDTTVSDPDGDTLSYTWYFDGILQNVTESGASYTAPDSSDATHSIRVDVSDGTTTVSATDTFTVTASVTFIVSNMGSYTVSSFCSKADSATTYSSDWFEGDSLPPNYYWRFTLVSNGIFDFRWTNASTGTRYHENVTLTKGTPCGLKLYETTSTAFIPVLSSSSSSVSQQIQSGTEFHETPRFIILTSRD